MKKFKKRNYEADCLQLSVDNQKEALELLGEEASPYGVNCILLRGDHGIQTVRVGDWVVRGENGVVKSYVPASFHAKYEEIKD